MDPTCVFNFFTFFERILYKSNCIIFIFSWCRTHTKIRSKLVVIVMAGSQKITLWGPQRTPLGILRVNNLYWYSWFQTFAMFWMLYALERVCSQTQLCQLSCLTTYPFQFSHTQWGWHTSNLYAFFWVIPRRMNFICRHFRTLCLFHLLNRLRPNDPYMGRTAPLTSKRCILYIHSTDTSIGTEYFKHAPYSPFFSLQNAVCFIMLICLVPVLFTFSIQGVLKLKKKIIPAPKG